MVSWEIERDFIIQITIVKQSEKFLKGFGSIGPTSSGKGEYSKSSYSYKAS